MRPLLVFLVWKIERRPIAVIAFEPAVPIPVWIYIVVLIALRNPIVEEA